MAARILAGIALLARLAFSEDVSVESALAADDTCRAGSEECGLDLRQLRGESVTATISEHSTEALAQTGEDKKENDETGFELAIEDNATDDRAVCKRWAQCHRGWFGGIRCSGGRYCVGWLQGEATEHSAEALAQTGEDKKENDETGFELAIEDNATDDRAVCKRWAQCHRGWFGGIRCSGGRYCVGWLQGEATEHSAEALAQTGEDKKENDETGFELAIEDDGHHPRRCRRWARCEPTAGSRGILCPEGRYCVDLLQGEATEHSAEALEQTGEDK
ncbi:unnamed protein product [Polarella glacialis]|uniref:Uncharacterized protein n=1 Tax=Polarella glacialis TaxID=89957 RepID=A0A813GMG8_POLGL|nr:unnamed protein product [Polarella glacialis]